MYGIKKFAIEHLEKADYRIFIPESVNRFGFLILHIERNVDDMKITQLGYDPEKKANTLDVHLCSEEFQKAEQFECKSYIASVVTEMLSELAEPAMVSHKDHELIEGVSDELTKFYEKDEKNRAVVCLIMDKNTERINGVILGERNNLLSGIRHALSKDNQMLADISDLCLQMISRQMANIVRKAKNTNNQ